MKIYNKNNSLIYIHVPKCGGQSLKKQLDSIFYKSCHIKAFFFTDPRKVISYNRSVIDKSEILSCHFYNNSVTKTIINAEVKTKYSDLEVNSNQFITFLREPLNRAESLYLFLQARYLLLKPNNYKDFFKSLNLENIKWLILAKIYHRKTTNDFIKFFKKYLNNYEKFLLSDINHSFLQHFPIELNSHNYKKRLEDIFVFIGIQENYNESIRILFKKLGHKAPQSIFKKNVTNNINSSQKINSSIGSLSQEVIAKFKRRYALDYLVYEHTKKLLRDLNES